MSDRMQVDKPAVREADAFPVESLRMYYGRLFPSKILYDWLGYGDPQYFLRREVALTKKHDLKGEEFFVRFNSYPDPDAFRKAVVPAEDTPPVKVDYGAVYNVSPAQRQTVSLFEPQEKELVFDIDANDYDDVRVCKCKGTPSVCSICWQLLVTAVKVLDVALRDDFGFQNIVWIFSGRRGVHCWVCDPRARRLTQDAREAVAAYLAVNIGGKGQRGTPFKKDTHPAIERAFELLKPYFEDLVETQGLLDRKDHATTVLSYAPPTPKNLLSKAWQTMNLSSLEKWEQFVATVEKFNKDQKLTVNPVYDVVFYYSYPRLDIQVSRQFNHLLKSPFVIHPGTGKVCVPIDVDKLTSFDPNRVPTLAGLIDELNAGKDWEQTSLGPYIKSFKKFVNSAIQAAAKDKQAQARDKPSTDF